MNDTSTTESKESTSSPSSSSQNVLGTPIAIVIAGGLIALAIYYGGGASRQAPANDVPEAVPVADEQAQPEAGPVEVAPVTAEDHVLGSPNAKITIIEYSDLECPFCKRFHPTVKQALAEYPDDVRWVYRHFPLEAIHPNARIAAVASECAGEQGLFWEFTDYLFENTSTGAEIAKDKLPGLAIAAGVPNATAFTTCLDSGKYDQKVTDQMNDAQAAGGRGTPYSVLVPSDGGDSIPFSGAQPYTALKAAIDSLL